MKFKIDIDMGKIGLATLLAIFGVGCSSSNHKSMVEGGRESSIYLEGVSLLSSASRLPQKCTTNPTDLKGKNWKGLLLLANGCVKGKDWPAVERLADAMARQDLNSPWSAYYISLAAENSDDLPRALWMIGLALKKTPDVALFLYQKGRVLWQMKSYKESVQEINTAIKREPRLLDAMIFLGRVYQRDLNFDLAVGNYERGLKVDAKNRDCLEGLGDLRFAQGKNEKASEFYAAAVAVATDDFKLRLKLAQATEGIAGNQEVALTHYRAARDLSKRRAGERAEFDLNEKIKILESKVLETKTGKTAQLEKAPPAPAGTGAPRGPATVIEGGAK